MRAGVVLLAVLAVASSLVACATPTMDLKPNTPGIYDLRSGERVEEAALLSQLRAVDVVVVGESHDSEQDHALQLKLYSALTEGEPWRLGMEMFQRPFQPALDQYIAGEISEDEMLKVTRYQERWGFEVGMYAPLWRRALETKNAVDALNVRKELTKRVSAVGLEKLTKWEKADVPEVVEGPPEYAAWLRDVFSSHGMTLDDARFRRFFQAQLLWDETMADTVWNQVMKGQKVFVVVGRGHVERGWGIPSRITRRGPDTQVVTILSASRFDSIDRMASEALADFAVVH